MKTTPQKRWFKAKEYGWGWTPVSIEGWIATLVFALGYVFLIISYLGWLGAATEAHQVNYREVALSTLEFLTAFVLLTYALTRVCTRFGEAPSWRWGKK